MNGTSIDAGDLLEGHLSADGQCVRLARDYICVAQIEADGARSLIEALRQPPCSGVIQMRATRVSPISGFIKLIVAEGLQ
jgi:hypothetical protein